MSRFRQICAVAALFAALTAFPASADQADKRLDALFSRLHATTNETEARSLENAIWAIWIEFRDTRTKDVLDAGIRAMNAGKLAVALAAFDQVVTMAPEFAEGWNKRATVYFLLRRFDASVEDIAQTLILEPRHFGALSGLGQINIAIGRNQAAVKAFQQALQANPHLRGLRELIKTLKEGLKGEET